MSAYNGDVGSRHVVGEGGVEATIEKVIGEVNIEHLVSVLAEGGDEGRGEGERDGLVLHGDDALVRNARTVPVRRAPAHARERTHIRALGRACAGTHA